ncbi:MAG: hypothetical protein AB4426_33905 [Xenococcaceae cyanobacterium]
MNCVAATKSTAPATTRCVILGRSLVYCVAATRCVILGRSLVYCASSEALPDSGARCATLGRAASAGAKPSLA